MADPIITGLIHVTGEPDSGKSTFAISAGPLPEEIAFFDDDLKGEAMHRELKFGVYHNLVRRFAQSGKTKPIDYYLMTLDLLHKLPDNHYKLLIWDNFVRIEDGISAWSEANIDKISDMSANQARAMGQVVWVYTYQIYSKMLDLMLSKAPLVIMTSHLREKYIGKQKSGLFEPRGQRPITEKSSLRLWLRHNPDGPEPIGLVLKRVARRQVTPSGITTVSVLPRRLKPCTWERIGWYWDNPVGNRALTADEIPNDFELSILDGTLTADQKDMLRLAKIEAEREAREEQVTQQSMQTELLTAKVKELLENGMGPGDVAQELGIPLPQVLKLKG